MSLSLLPFLSGFTEIRFANNTLACQIEGVPGTYSEGILPGHTDYWRPTVLGGHFEFSNSLRLHFGKLSYIYKIHITSEFVDNRPLSINVDESMDAISYFRNKKVDISTLHIV